LSTSRLIKFSLQSGRLLREESAVVNGSKKTIFPPTTVITLALPVSW